MTLGWKVMLPTALAYVMVVAATVLVLDLLEVPYGFTFGLVLTLVSGICTVAFMFFLDSDRIISGASVPHRQDRPVRMPVAEVDAGATGVTGD